MISFDDFLLLPGTPIYWQIILYLKRGIAAGTVANGDELPSRRTLSALLGVNPNTVQKAYRLLEEEGYHAAAPHLEQLKRGFDIVKMNFTSHWSERHVAFVAGLGTFGLSAGLITERGIAMRVGSVVTDLELPPTPRSYGDDPFAWCTRCGACERRCPAHAIGKTNAERDKPRCAAYIVNHVSPDRGSRYGWYDLALGCGLCQTAVPCEFHRP